MEINILFLETSKYIIKEKRNPRPIARTDSIKLVHKKNIESTNNIPNNSVNRSMNIIGKDFEIGTLYFDFKIWDFIAVPAPPGVAISEIPAMKILTLCLIDRLTPIFLTFYDIWIPIIVIGTPLKWKL